MTATPGEGPEEAGLGELLYRLRTAEDVETFVGAIDAHGWLVPLSLLVAVGVVRGVFAHLADPFVIAEGYLFPGWPAALAINLVYGVFTVLFAWFLFFGLAASFAGYFSDVHALDTAVMKTGAFFNLLFVPTFLVASAIALTLTVPESVPLPEEPQGLGGGVEAYTYVYDTVQFRVINGLKAVTWIVVGFLLLPVIAERYEISNKQSVLAVLPVTIGAVLSTQLV